MCCAAGIATLEVYQEEDLIDNSRRMGGILGSYLEAIKERHPIVGDVRCIGLFSVLELVKDRETREPADVRVMGLIKEQLLKDGLSTFVNKNLVFACPPLCINQAELLEGLQIIEHAIQVAEQAG
jgi:taurine--2-oxoglutarate transaminase